MSTHIEPSEIFKPGAPSAAPISAAISVPDAAGVPPALAQLRAELDAIDDQIHDLLMQRAAVVERVARDGGKSKTGAKIRPGREASMLRRLLARHKGAMPPQTILRFWREMFAGALIIEGGQTVAVCSGDDSELAALAREHFGPLTPLRKHRNPAQALADIERGTAQVAVLPLPGDEPDRSWWTALMGTRNPLSVIGKLPFWTQRPEGTPNGEAYVVAAMRPDPSGADRGLIALELASDISRTRIIGNLTHAGFAPGTIWLKRISDAELLALVEVDGLVEEDDPRLEQISGLLAPASVIGGFALPLEPG
jgi:chorismate mutase/prephenate dehydratase